MVKLEHYGSNDGMLLENGVKFEHCGKIKECEICYIYGTLKKTRKG